jgi:hypothetical protein
MKEALSGSAKPRKAAKDCSRKMLMKSRICLFASAVDQGAKTRKKFEETAPGFFGEKFWWFFRCSCLVLLAGALGGCRTYNQKNTFGYFYRNGDFANAERQATDRKSVV